MRAECIEPQETDMEPPEITEVDDDIETVSCDGGGGQLGHPTVYFQLGDNGQADCYYCGRRFITATAARSTAAAGERGDP